MSEISYAAALSHNDKSSVHEIIAKSGSIDSICDFPNLRSLDLCGNTSIVDFSFLRKLPALEKLYLSGMELSSIPIELDGHELTTLHISDNEIKDLSLLGSLAKLVDLGLAEMGLRKIPDVVLQIRGLRILGICDNDISNISSLKKLPLLEELYVGSNRIKKIPNELTKLKSLRLLDITQNNFLTDVSVVGKLSGLEELLMGHSPDCNEIPAAVFELGKLKKLTLHLSTDRGDRLVGLTCVSKLQDLEELWIVGACMEALPPEFCELKKLRVLKLTSNESLSDIEALHDLPALVELDLHKCALRKIPAGFSSLTALKKLDISLNDDLSDVSDLRELPSLEELVFYSKMTEFPASMGSLTGLKKLVLSSKSAEVGFLSSLTSLEELMVKGCSFEKLPSSLVALKKLRIFRKSGDDAFLSGFTKLEELTLSQKSVVLPAIPSLNKLEIVEADGAVDLSNIKSMPQLHTLDLSRLGGMAELPQEIAECKELTSIRVCFLHRLKDISALRDLPSLQNLEIGDCKKLSVLPEKMATLTALQTLKLDSLDKLSNLSVIGEIKGLVHLELESLDRLKALPDSLKGLEKLSSVIIDYCENLRDVSVLENVVSLTTFDCKGSDVSKANIKKVEKAITSHKPDAKALETSYQSFMESGRYKTLVGQEDRSRRYSFPLSFDTPEGHLESMEDFDWLDDHRAGDYDEEDEEETQEGAILSNAEGGLKPLAILDFAYEGCEDQDVDSYSEEIFLVDVDDPQNPVFIWTHDGEPSRIHSTFDAFLGSLQNFQPEDEEDDEEDETENTTYLEFVSDGSSKFWQVTVCGNSHTVVYGKIGSKGSSKTKEFADEGAAQKDAERLAKSKIKKGYTPRES